MSTVQSETTLDSSRLAYRIDDLAEALGVSRTKLYSEIAAGKLRAVKLGSRTLITTRDANDYLSRLPDIRAALPGATANQIQATGQKRGARD
jgi:excisionase family DNA binding protein